MREIQFRGKSFKFESMREHDEHIETVVKECIKAIEPLLNGLNAVDIDRICDQIKRQLPYSCTFSCGTPRASV